MAVGKTLRGQQTHPPPMRLLFSTLLFVCLSTLFAQGLYTVQVGSFRDVTAADFPEISQLAFLYGAPQQNGVTDVYLGNFSSEARAKEVADRLRNGRYPNARVLMLPTDSGTPITVVQLAYQKVDSDVDWEGLSRAGELYVESVDGINRIVVGIYPDNSVALNYLPEIKALGYDDAFVKKVNNVRLVPVRTFETGIKTPLIPISLQERQPEATPATASASSPPSPAAPAPAAYESGTPLIAAGSRSGTTLGLPDINARMKSSAAASLQRSLKARNFYQGSIDGLYGPGTEAAFLAAWNRMPEVQKYKLLSSRQTAPVAPELRAWPTLPILATIADEMAAGTTNQERFNQLINQRAALLASSQPLSPAAASRVRNWATTLWGNLDQWSSQDPLHAQIVAALEIAYYQTQVRLENHFADQGLEYIAARDLATATLQNLIGAQLNRFL